MTLKEANKLYVRKFIHSMENHYKDWTMTVYSGMEGSWDEYRSPDYPTTDGKISFGIGACNTGAWIDGNLRWTLPTSVLLNMFSSDFWKFRRAARKMKSYLKQKAKEKYVEELNRAI